MKPLISKVSHHLSGTWKWRLLELPRFQKLSNLVCNILWTAVNMFRTGFKICNTYIRVQFPHFLQPQWHEFAQGLFQNLLYFIAKVFYLHVILQHQCYISLPSYNIIYLCCNHMNILVTPVLYLYVLTVSSRVIFEQCMQTKRFRKNIFHVHYWLIEAHISSMILKKLLLREHQVCHYIKTCTREAWGVLNHT